MGTESKLADAGMPVRAGQPGLTGGAGPASTAVLGGDDFTSTTPPLHTSDHLGVMATVQTPP